MLYCKYTQLNAKTLGGTKMGQPVSLNTNRSAFWDNFKGILIFLVVFAHILYDVRSWDSIALIVKTIYVFHMPAFVFTTGFLSKSKHSCSGKSLLKLLFAYFIFNTITMVYSYFAQGDSILLLSPYNSNWYLLAVIVWRLIADKIPRTKAAFAVIICAAIAVGFFGDVTNILSIARIIAFFPFFIAGYFLPEDKLKEFLTQRKPSHYAKGVFLVIVSVFLALLAAVRFGLTTDRMMMFPFTSPADILTRAVIFAISAFFILGMTLALPEKKIPLLTKMGRNSLSIFLLHRIPTIIISHALAPKAESFILVVSVLSAVGIVVVCSLDVVAGFVNKIISKCAEAFSEPKKGLPVKICAAVVACAVTFIPASNLFKNYFESAAAYETKTESSDVIFEQLDSRQTAAFQDNMRVLFAGDLILLEDQVKRGFTGSGYDFDNVFEFAKKYISAADIAVGIFEGPTAGAEVGYSTSNYGDGKTLKLNFPDEFAQAVKNAGFDLVSTANNHLLDCGVSGALRTLDMLDEIGLDHTGSYRNSEEKSAVKIIEKDGIRIAVLSYTYGSNGYSEEDLLDEKLSYLTSLVTEPNGANFEKARALVEEDFARAKQENPDLIFVIPHMGTQFTDAPDNYQQTWTEIFLSLGADAVLNDHTHSVQPVEVLDRDGKTKAVVNCPGNFANIYHGHDGDASALTEIYIDRQTKAITGIGVIPMWTQSQISGNYRALPIYDILHDDRLREQISAYDLERIEAVNKHITTVMLGKTVPFEDICERYFVTADGLFLTKSEQAAITEKAEKSVLYQKLISAKSVCFVGDSITEGTKNGGYGWYRAIEDLSENVSQCAKGGGTTKTILPKVASDSDFYVVALGTNDVRYRDEEICAMTTDEYINTLQDFADRIRSENPSAEFAFIAPWLSLENDKISALPHDQKIKMMSEYSDALEKWCSENCFIFSNPNEQISRCLELNVQADYLVDFIHPNKEKGIALYSRAVLENSVQ